MVSGIGWLDGRRTADNTPDWLEQQNLGKFVQLSYCEPEI